MTAADLAALKARFESDTWTERDAHALLAECERLREVLGRIVSEWERADSLGGGGASDWAALSGIGYIARQALEGK